MVISNYLLNYSDISPYRFIAMSPQTPPSSLFVACLVSACLHSTRHRVFIITEQINQRSEVDEDEDCVVLFRLIAISPLDCFRVEAPTEEQFHFLLRMHARHEGKC